MKMAEEISPIEMERQITVVGGEEVITIKEAVIMKNHAHILDYAKWTTTTQMVIGISVEDAHGTHITYKIAEADNKTRPTLLKEMTLKMSSTLS